MLTIELNNLRFYAFHGLYKEEKKIGGEFIVDILVSYLPENFAITQIDETIDYTAIYSIAKNIMSHPEPLIETVAGKIAGAIFSKFSRVESLTVGIRKMNAPISAFEGNVAVKFAVKRNQIL